MFYNPEIDQNTNTFFFNKEESKHIVKVNRKQSGDIVTVTNGKGILFTTEIIIASDSKCQVKVLELYKDPEPKYSLHLAVAPTKMNERFEWFLEKSTEIGIAEITPIICEHSERKVINKERFEKIILSAMKQSNQYFLPVLNDAISFKDFVSKTQTEQKYIAHCENNITKNELIDVLIKDQNVLILIGPEGDFSGNEIAMATENKFRPIALGNTRLRTETAAIVATHTVVLKNNN